MLARAERMHRQFFPPSGSRSPVAWEPPVDILETERAVLVLVALPGVNFDEVKALDQSRRIADLGMSDLSGGNADRDHPSPRAAARPI